MTASEIAQRPKARSQSKNRYRNRLTDTLTRKRSPVHAIEPPHGSLPDGAELRQRTEDILMRPLVAQDLGELGVRAARAVRSVLRIAHS
jgi:hypothetical protein